MCCRERRKWQIKEEGEAMEGVGQRSECGKG